MSGGSSSREDSPDWLRSFQAPTTQSAVTLSSGSSSPLSDDEDEINLSKLFQKEKSDSRDPQAHNTSKPKLTPGRKRKKDDHSSKPGKNANESKGGPKASGKPSVPSEPIDSVWTLSSDSDSFPDSKPVSIDALLDNQYDGSDKAEYKQGEKDEIAICHDDGESSLQEGFTVKTPKKKLKKETATKSEKVNVHENREKTGDMDVEENASEKCTGLNVSSRLPLVLIDKVQRSKALVECEGDSIDLSGDVGAVGRVVISDDSSGNHEMQLDLKGTIYRTSILPSRTFCVVSFGQSEAKIEAIMNDFIQLTPQANVYEAETMVEGTLDGFSFDSDDEVDNLPKALTNQGEVAEEQSKGKTKQKAEKASAAPQKKIKTAGGKKVKKKSQAPKKSRTKK